MKRVIGFGSEWDEATQAAERDIVGQGASGSTAMWQEGGGMGKFNLTSPASDEAKRFGSWGTALKPSWEPIVVGRKPE